MTPMLFNCTQQCLFCWRTQSSDYQTPWNEMKLPKPDSPEDIIKESIETQLKILTGYKDNPKTNKQKLKEALKPKHTAISLTGEPTLYSHIGDLIKAFHKQSFTTFLVTNGTMPKRLEKLSQEPTQLYLSLCAPNEKVHKQVCRPQVPDAWRKILETLKLLQSFSCPTVIRITAAKGLNMKNTEAYAKLINEANPTYVEPKAYMHVGFSRLRLTYENTPSHKEILNFSEKLAEEAGYKLIDESEESRVALLSRLDKPLKLT